MSIPVLDLSSESESEDERTHGLTVHGIVACRGLHIVRAVRQQLGYRVHALTGNQAVDAARVTCPECRAILGLEGAGA
jgi:hypothetical protein